MMRLLILTMSVFVCILSGCGNEAVFKYDDKYIDINEIGYSSCSKADDICVDKKQNRVCKYNELYFKESMPLGHILVATICLRNFTITADNVLWELYSNKNASQVGQEVQKAIMDNVIYVATGMSHILILRGDGSLWAYGSNLHGEIGDGTTESRWQVPIKVFEDIIAVAAGFHSSFAIRADGTMWAWGATSNGRLGNGISSDWYEEFNPLGYAQPTPVKILDDITSIATTETHGMALRADGSLWVWGSNNFGAIGDSTITVRKVGSDGSLLGEEKNNDAIRPIKIMEHVVYIAAGTHTSFAIDTNNNLWAWGFNRFGQLGDGTTVNRLSPVKIMENVVSVAPGFAHTLVIRRDGSLYGWGENYFGELGDGTTEYRNTPVKIMSDVKFVTTGVTFSATDFDPISGSSGGAGRSFAIKTDGSLWGWGAMYPDEDGIWLTPRQITYDMLMP